MFKLDIMAVTYLSLELYFESSLGVILQLFDSYVFIVLQTLVLSKMHIIVKVSDRSSSEKRQTK